MREPDTAHLTIANADAMRELGRALGTACLAVRSKALIVALRGELGAGKTTLVSGVLNAIGIAGPARSPTYTLIEPYEVADRQFFHLDLYRLADPHEVEALGLRDLLAFNPVLLIEWPDRGTGMIPPVDLEICIQYLGDDRRDVTLTAHGVTGRELLNHLSHVR
jgi:tRNA threonylcarbamoyladenosine biosynthesis protein TsaE